MGQAGGSWWFPAATPGRIAEFLDQTPVECGALALAGGVH
jgi:hypothetical protein